MYTITLVRHLTVVALLLPLFGGVADVHAQGVSVPLGGPPYECRQGWDFVAGSVLVHFNAGYHIVRAPHPTWFEAAGSCGNSRVSISLNAWVKNVRVWVTAYPFIAQVFPGGGSVSGLGGRYVTVPGPTTFVDISSTGGAGSRVTVGDISFELADPPALFSFGATTTGRVLTHKYRSDDAYPSPLQTEDGKIRVEGLVHDLTGSTGIGDRKVYFRLIDPPDTADYAMRAGDAKVDDNVDGPGKLNGSSTAMDTSDSSGKVSVTLEITDHAAGDNYQIEASLDKDFKCSSAPCQNQKSIVYTAWKRVYFETSTMFRKGAFVTKDIRADAGTGRVTASDISQFRTGDTVRLIHAPPRQTVAGPPAPSVTPQFDFYSEDHVIAVRPQSTQPDGKIVPAHLELQPLPNGTPNVLQYSYGPDDSFGGGVSYLGDAVGVITPAGAPVYVLDDVLLDSVFKEAFVEYVRLPGSIGELPYLPTVNGPAITHLSHKWPQSSVIRGTGGKVQSRPNHQYAISASRLPTDPLAPNGQPGAEFGQTLNPIMGGFSRSWIWGGRIEAAVGEPTQPVHAQSPTSVMKEVVVHEIGHQWKVNQAPASSSVNLGHCLEERYQQDGKYCLMHMPFNDPGHNPEFGDGAVALHYRNQNSAIDSEYITIRRALEPVPVQ